ncbi:MAG TPA: EAL domain-containing protein, partial [Thermoanaerobaculia bacterium]|nr:EAL domain-containing protein [Thermoanaerobaculia bacterium]
RILGLDGNMLPSLKRFLRIVHPDDRALVRAAIRGSLKKHTPLQFEHRIVLPGGLIRFVRHSADYKLDRRGNPVWLRGVLEDITEQKQAEQLSWYRSNFDGLTRLPNRALFCELLDKAFAQARRAHRLVAVLYIDIDGFRVVNETMGLRTGDFVLQRVAERLRNTLRASDFIARGDGRGPKALARLGSDEFVVALSDVKYPEGAARAASRLLEAFGSSLQLGDREIFLTATIGIAVHPPDAPDVEALLQHAETAMHHAKAQARGSYRFYTDAMNETVMRRIDLESRLRKALETGQLFLEYQPVVEIQRQRIVGAEALLRWNCPGLGPIAPAEFITIAEESLSLITPIEGWVLETACRQMRKWTDEGLSGLRLSVNASRSQLRQSNFAAKVARVLETTGLPSRQLQLELTENGVIAEDPSTLRQLSELKELGVSLAIDDFGTGSSALGYLRKFPVDMVKIDRSFIRRIPDNRQDEAFVSAVIAMAHCLGIRVVAEGVETEEQLAFLRRSGCDEVQGFLFAKSQSSEGLRRLLARNQVGLNIENGSVQVDASVVSAALTA